MEGKDGLAWFQLDKVEGVPTYEAAEDPGHNVVGTILSEFAGTHL